MALIDPLPRVPILKRGCWWETAAPLPGQFWRVWMESGKAVEPFRLCGNHNVHTQRANAAPPMSSNTQIDRHITRDGLCARNFFNNQRHALRRSKPTMHAQLRLTCASRLSSSLQSGTLSNGAPAFPLRATATAFIAMSKIRPLCENEKSSSEAWLSRKRSPDTRSTPKELFSAITIKRGQIQCGAFLTERVVEGITHTQNSQNTQKHTHTIVILTLLSVVFGARTDFCFAETQKDISSLTNCVRGCGQCCRVTRPCPAAAPRPVCRRHFRMSFTTVNTNQHSPTTQHN